MNKNISHIRKDGTIVLKPNSRNATLDFNSKRLQKALKQLNKK